MIEHYKFKLARAAFGFVVLAVCGLIASNDFARAQTAKAPAAATGGAAKTADEDLTPVVLIHGIGGSDLRRVSSNDDAGKSKDLLHDGFPNDVLIGFLGKPKNLQFDDATGAPRIDTISKDLAATAFFDVPQRRDITDLSKFLQARGYAKDDRKTKNKDARLFEFYYDFRFSVPQIAARLGAFIDRVKSQTGATHVDLIGHSLGGVVVKQYLLSKANARSVRVAILAATPNLGAPKALKALRYGDDLDFSIIDRCKLKRAVHNMPSVFNLLPGKRYFAAFGGGYFIDGAAGELDYERTLFNLKNDTESRCPMRPEKGDAPPFDRLSENLIRENLENFRDAQDDWTKPAGVKVFVVAGFNVPTLKTIKEERDRLTFAYTTEGDGTVPLWSAETCDADRVYYADFKELKTDHSQMIGAPEIDSQIYKLLRNGAGIYASGISTARPDSKLFETKSTVERFSKSKLSAANKAAKN